MVRFAVFDLDGTLVDSQRDLSSAANALVRELGGAPLSELEVGRMVGEGARVLVWRVLTAAGLDPATPGALPRFLDLYGERLVEHTAPYDGIVPMLETLAARMPLAVLTNKPQAVTERLLQALRLETFFQHVIGGDTAFGRKPAPAALVRLCELVDVAPVDTVLVGDSPIDLQTARNAATQILLVSYGFGFRFEPGTLTGVPVVDSASNVARHITQAI